MPQQPSEKIDHSSISDHRILRTQSEIPEALQNIPASALDLISDTEPSDESKAQNLRNLALAYAQVGARYPEFDEKALQILEAAAAAFPTDPEVQATYGKALDPGAHRKTGSRRQGTTKMLLMPAQNPLKYRPCLLACACNRDR